MKLCCTSNWLSGYVEDILVQHKKRLCKYAWSTELCVIHSRKCFLLFRALPKVVSFILQNPTGDTLFCYRALYQKCSLMLQSPTEVLSFLYRILLGVLSLVQSPPGVLTFVTEPYRECSLALQSSTCNVLFCYRALPKCSLIQSPSGSPFFCLDPLPEVLYFYQSTFVTEPYQRCSFCNRDLPGMLSCVTELYRKCSPL